MTFALTLAAIRRHPFSAALTTLVALATASFLGIPTPLAIAAWAAGTLVTFEVWYALEPFALRRLGRYRTPTHAEHERLDPALGRSQLCVLIAEAADLNVARGLRCVVISRDLMDLFEDRALSGLLAQTAASIHRAALAGTVLVWLGSLPILGAWCLTRVLGQFGRLLAVVVGTSLVVPLVLWRDGFVRWCGRLFGSIFVGLLGSMSLSSGFAAAGLGIMIAWLVVPGVKAIVAWESRRAEIAADRVAVAAGFGQQLLEALELLALAEPRPAPGGLLSLLCRPGASLVDRAERIRRALADPEVTD